MYQPTIDTHLATRHTHVQVPFGATAAPDASRAALGAEVLAARSVGPHRSWARRSLVRVFAHRSSPSARPTHIPAG